jgi:Fe-S cluster biogenesis protein NfuA
MTDPAFRDRIARLESLIQAAEHMRDPAAQSQTREIVQAILDLHGAGLGRILELAAGTPLIDALAHDDLVSGLLLLYGLHPLDFAQRLAQALDEVRPFLQAHGGDVELLDQAGGVVRLRMQVNGHGCASTAGKLRAAVEEAIYARAPDVEQIEITGLPEPVAAMFVPVEQLTLRRTSDVGEPSAGACAYTGHEQG